MLSAFHLLLSYKCTLACDHCFLYSAPSARGTMTIGQITNVLDESQKLGTIKDIYFEGGEPFLFYALMIEGIRQARERGFKAGIVTNGYWATSVEDAKLWLKPVLALGVSDLTISDDELHHGAMVQSPARNALAAAEQLGVPASALRKARPEVVKCSAGSQEKGTPEISGGIKMRGRAVEKFAKGLPTRRRAELVRCPYEALAEPARVHLDAYGNVQICQGISIGNFLQKPLSAVVKDYDPQRHPICGPLLRGGPIRLVEEYRLDLPGEYIDECHLCFAARLALLDRFPEYLAPRQVYGLG
ncbi:MAG: radical SAM protein [Candidatus Brocadiia bacterium]